MHKIVQVQVIPNSPECKGYFLVVCEDGTLWSRVYKYDREGSGPATNHRWEWEQIAPPPIVHAWKEPAAQPQGYTLEQVRAAVVSATSNYRIMRGLVETIADDTCAELAKGEPCQK